MRYDIRTANLLIMQVGSHLNSVLPIFVLSFMTIANEL